MTVETLVKAVHCDLCSNSTDGYSKFDSADFTLPSAKQIRDYHGYRRVLLNGRFVDLCPECYQKHFGTCI